MNDMNLDLARFNMVEQQVRTWDVLNPRVLDALARTPREDYAAEEYRKLSYADTELPIGSGQVMLKPVVAARCLQTLNIQPDDSVLEIGTGTGYITAVISKLASQIHSIEIDHDLYQQAKTNLFTNGIHNVILHEGDATQEMNWGGPFDAIFATGSFPAEVPQHLLQKLKLGGRMLAVIGEHPLMQACLITRISDTEWQREEVFETSIPALQNLAKPRHFSL